MTTHTIKTRSRAPFAIVGICRTAATVVEGKLVSGEITGVELLGYAHTWEAGIRRARRLSYLGQGASRHAVVAEIRNGKVEVAV